MKRKKSRPAGAGGPTWRDVLRGESPEKPADKPGRCRDCGAVCRLPVREWYHASAPRCFRCGGVLDKMRDRGQGERA